MAVDTEKTLRNQVLYSIYVRNYSEAGTFAAVQADLDRIKALGTDIIWLLPIHPTGEKHRKGTLGSPYAIRDYRAVNPEFGTLDDFRHLVDAIHDRGMKCIIDVVYNHTSPDSWLAEHHPEWFFHKPDGSLGNRFGDWWDVADLDYSHMELWEYQIETLKYWARLVDGFRCDVASAVPLAFWREAREQVERVRPGEDADIADADFIYMGAGTERAQKAALADFARYGAAVKAAAENGTAMLFAGNSMELLGASITDDAGKVYAGIGLADFTAVQGKKRFVEDVYGHTALFEDAVVGFVNRCSVLTGVKTPLLTDMELGCGNEGPCGPEGYHSGSVFTSQLTGPILVKNPALLRIMVQTIYKHRGESCPEVPVDNYMTQGWAITAEQLKARCRK